MFYAGIVVIVFGGLFSFVFFNVVYRAPSCVDGIKDGNETGIDCGGSCPNLCQNDTIAPIIYWSKAFNISGSVYNLAAYVENPNLDSVNGRATYEFKVFDSSNILIGTRDGQTFIPKNQKFIVFEPGFIAESKVPKYVEFDFTGFAPWQKSTTTDPGISVDYSALSSTTTAPRNGRYHYK